MDIRVFNTVREMGRAAGTHAAAAIRESIKARGEANIILATGASQFATLEQLVKEDGIAWDRVTMFHLDEYIGLDDTHPASFRRYLRERFAQQVAGLRQAHYVNGDAEDAEAECARLDALIGQHPIDVACIGIGENGHIAFNDPPADFETEKPYLIVDLDEACRRQQLGEGWFPSFDDVPKQAISMSVHQILKSRTLVVSVPDERKAAAVRNAVEGPLTNTCPASILREHSGCTLYLDKPAASLLSNQ